MNTRMWKSMFGVGMLCVLALAGAVLLMSAWGVRAEKPDKSNSQARKLEGTWRGEVTIRNCQTGAEVRTFPVLVTFARGGTMNATGAGSSPALVSPDYGVWRHIGGHTYSGLTESFLFSPAGTWIGTQRVTRVIEIGEDPDEFTATTSAQFIGPDGNPIPGFPPVPICATSVARRLE